MLLDRESREELRNCEKSIDESRWDEGSETVNVILGIDPRSPTIEFTRTPIIVGAVTKGNKLENKNLSNVLRSEIQTPPTARIRQSNGIPPRLIGSTVLSPLSAAITPITNKRNSVGLLETNLDYTETNLDIAQNNTNTSLPMVLNEVSPISNKLKKQAEVLSKNDITHLDKMEILLHEIDCQAEKTVNVTEQVKDFDKKLTNLIYEDDTDNEQIFKISKPKVNNRTPLATRNSNEEPKRNNIIRLKVHDKPRKSEGSRIPVFKDVQKRAGIQQCENTPPRSMGETRIKTKLSRWDADKTIII